MKIKQNLYDQNSTKTYQAYAQSFKGDPHAVAYSYNAPILLINNFTDTVTITQFTDYSVTTQKHLTKFIDKYIEEFAQPWKQNWVSIFLQLKGPYAKRLKQMVKLGAANYIELPREDVSFL